MQGHFEGQQPSPYASISVNNPSRYTNSNLVNRRYMEQQAQQQSQTSPMPIKPVIPRRRTANNNNNNNNNAANEVNQQQHQQMIQSSSSILNHNETQEILRSPSPPTHHTVTTISQDDIKPNLQSLSSLPQFNNNGTPITNLPANVEIATLFTMSFNQNFPNHTNQ